MNPAIVVLAALICSCGGANVFAQSDSTRYINGLPVSEDDTVQQFPRNDLGPSNKLIPLTAKQLPPSVLEALEEKAQYQGWQDSTVYFEKNTGLYIVPVKYEEGVKIFGLNENGKPVTFSEVSP